MSIVKIQFCQWALLNQTECFEGAGNKPVAEKLEKSDIQVRKLSKQKTTVFEKTSIYVHIGAKVLFAAFS